MEINTLDYGRVEVKYDKGYMNDEVIDIIETCDMKYYEIRLNLNGKLVAVEI